MRATLILLGALTCCAALLYLEEPHWYVGAPLLSLFFILAWTTHALWEKDCGLPLFDIGLACVLATFVYSAMPLIAFWVNGFTFGGLNDGRLMHYSPTPEELGNFHWRHVLYLAALALSYVISRQTSHLPTGKVESADTSQRIAILFLFFLLWSFYIALELVTGFSAMESYTSDNYMANLEVLSSLPLIVQQIFGKMNSYYNLAKLAVLFLMIQKCHYKGWRFILLIWLLCEFAFTFQMKAGRSGFVFLVIGAALMYHRLVAPFSLRFLVTAGVLFLALFVFMGIHRGQASLADTQELISLTQGGLLGVGGEFESLLATAYDVYKRAVVGDAEVPWYVYMYDLHALLPPQQIMPFEKVAASEWYLRLLGISGEGAGYMWGVISQSIVGLGWTELALRGCLLGFILAQIHQWYMRRHDLFWANLIYIYLCIRIYYTFRDTTGALLTIVVWEVLPFLVMVLVIRALVPASGAREMQTIRSNVQGMGTRLLHLE